jgi:hypothetical protein
MHEFENKTYAKPDSEKNQKAGTKTEEKDAVKAVDKVMKINESTTSKKMNGTDVSEAAKMSEANSTQEMEKGGQKENAMSAVASNVEVHYIIYYNQQKNTIEPRIVKDVGNSDKSSYFELHFTDFNGNVTTTDIDYPTYRGFVVLSIKKNEEKQKPTHDKNYITYQKYMTDGHFIQGVQFLIDTYNLNNGMSNYKIEIIKNANKDIQMFTGKEGEPGLEKGATLTIQIEDDYIRQSLYNYNEFADLVRGLGHEFVHLKDRTGDEFILTSPEREFRAYYFTVTATNLPDFHKSRRIFYIDAAISRYALMGNKPYGAEKQQKYKYEYETLLGIKSAYGEVDNSEKTIQQNINNKKATK